MEGMIKILDIIRFTKIISKYISNIQGEFLHLVKPKYLKKYASHEKNVRNKNWRFLFKI